MDSNGINVEPIYHGGRTWPANAIEEFIVGHVHGGYDFNQILLYITYNNVSLVGLTLADLESLWNVLEDSTNFHIAHWRDIHHEDPKVHIMLDRISTSLVQAQAVTP